MDRRAVWEERRAEKKNLKKSVLLFAKLTIYWAIISIFGTAVVLADIIYCVKFAFGSR